MSENQANQSHNDVDEWNFPSDQSNTQVPINVAIPEKTDYVSKLPVMTRHQRTKSDCTSNGSNYKSDENDLTGIHNQEQRNAAAAGENKVARNTPAREAVLRRKMPNIRRTTSVKWTPPSATYDDESKKVGDAEIPIKVNKTVSLLHQRTSRLKVATPGCMDSGVFVRPIRGNGQMPVAVKNTKPSSKAATDVSSITLFENELFGKSSSPEANVPKPSMFGYKAKTRKDKIVEEDASESQFSTTSNVRKWAAMNVNNASKMSQITCPSLNASYARKKKVVRRVVETDIETNLRILEEERRVEIELIAEQKALERERRKQEDYSKFTKGRERDARKTGILDLSGLAIIYVSPEIYKLNDTEFNDPPKNLEDLCRAEETPWWIQKDLVELNLSNNQIIEISPDLGALRTITHLNLSNNAIQAIPKEIKMLYKLVDLNLSKNQLSQLPIELFDLQDLKIFNLAENKFKELHSSFGNLLMMEKLDLSGNELTALPDSIEYMSRLKELNITRNKLSVLTSHFGLLHNLEKLDISQNQFKILPETISNSKLKILELNHSEIEQLPTFEGCDSLEILNLNGNKLKELPEEMLMNLLRLKRLSLLDNTPLQELPSEIGLCERLEYLDIFGTSISYLPTTLGNLAHLTILRFDPQRIKSVRRDILNCGVKRVLAALREQSLSTICQKYNTEPEKPKSDKLEGSSKMPSDGLNSPRSMKIGNEDDIFADRYKMRKTKCLDVTRRELSAVPEDAFLIARSEDVYYINLSNNRFAEVPAGMHHMKNTITELHMENNRLSVLPNFLSTFTHLSLINVAGNKLSELPPAFENIRSLRALNLSHNRFKCIPPAVYKLKNLEVLNLHCNAIEYIDATEDGLGGLKQLATLDLGSNDLHELPPLLGNLKQITTLDVQGNSFRYPRQGLIAKGTESLLAYLRDRIPK